MHCSRACVNTRGPTARFGDATLLAPGLTRARQTCQMSFMALSAWKNRLRGQHQPESVASFQCPLNLRAWLLDAHSSQPITVVLLKILCMRSPVRTPEKP
eukprot:symbB.v1.2.028661.t1/scaffold3059.1/size64457/4